MQRGNKKFSRTVQSISEKFFTLRFLSPYKAIEHIENNLKYSSYLESLTKKGYSRETLNQKVNILKLIAINTRSFNDFFERLIYLESIMQNSNLKNNGVTLTTAHSSKGLEFDEVIMVDLIDRQFPSAESLRLKKDENDSSLFEEEVRLFYVAITRAKNKLSIITSNSLNGEYVQISRFVRQLTDRLEEKSDKKIKSPNFKAGKVKKNISKEDIKIYVKGVNVLHKKFGEGIIHSNDGEIIEIYFTKSGLKKLSIRFCLERGLLSEG